MCVYILKSVCVLTVDSMIFIHCIIHYTRKYHLFFPGKVPKSKDTHTCVCSDRRQYDIRPLHNSLYKKISLVLFGQSP